MNWYFKNYRNEIPKDLIPIGNNHGGNQYLIGKGNSNIFYWKHDEPRKSKKSLEVVASSFSDLLKGLYEEPDDDLDVTITHGDGTIIIS